MLALVAILPTALTVPPAKSSVRRCAQSNDPCALAALLVGRSAVDIDADVDRSGRTALAHAAWRGDIRCVALLCDVGCDINRWSTGLHSYGKTPIFYAVTRCRDDVVELLLERGARTRILNNKGQSVLSLAATHLTPRLVRQVQAAEAAEVAASEACAAWLEEVARLPEQLQPRVHESGWLDFLSSHPDSQTYGDLDPRFCPPQEGEAATLVVKPTSHDSRRLHKHLSEERSLLWWPPRSDRTSPTAKVPLASAAVQPGSAGGMGRSELPDRVRAHARAAPSPERRGRRTDHVRSWTLALKEAEDADFDAFASALSKYAGTDLQMGIPLAFWDDC